MLTMTRLAVAMIVILALLAACSGAVQPTGRGDSADREQTSLVQTDSSGDVTVSAEWLGRHEGVAFEMKLDTHSVDLDALSLADAVLRNDAGETLRALPWEAALGGHHRAGRLYFEGDAEEFLAGATWIELVLRDVGSTPERVLRWGVAP